MNDAQMEFIKSLQILSRKLDESIKISTDAKEALNNIDWAWWNENRKEIPESDI